MQETGKSSSDYQHVLSIRLSTGGFSFSTYTPDGHSSAFQLNSYSMQPLLSIEENFMEAIRSVRTLREQRFNQVFVVVSDLSILMPREGFFPEEADYLFRHSFPEDHKSTILYNVIGGLDSVSIFRIKTEVQRMILERFPTARYYSTTACILEHLQSRSRIGEHKKLYCYFHDKQVDLFHFREGTLLFANSFAVNNSSDASYFTLSVWQTLHLNQENDELHILGDTTYKEELKKALSRYLHKVFYISPSAEFNRTPLSKIEDVPYDLLVLLQTLR